MTLLKDSMGPWKIRSTLLHLIFVLYMACIMAPTSVRADGGKIIQTVEREGWSLTLFSTPTPMRVGDVDFSAMVVDPQGKARRDCPLRFELRHNERRSHGGRMIDSQENAWLSHRILHLAEAGEYLLKVELRCDGISMESSAKIYVSAPEPPIRYYWRYFMTPLGLLLIFLLYQMTSPYSQFRSRWARNP